jgi:hypothetical protein
MSRTDPRFVSTAHRPGPGNPTAVEISKTFIPASPRIKVFFIIRGSTGEI